MNAGVKRSDLSTELESLTDNPSARSSSFEFPKYISAHGLNLLPFPLATGEDEVVLTLFKQAWSGMV